MHCSRYSTSHNTCGSVAWVC